MTPVITCLTAAGLLALAPIPRGADGQTPGPASRIIEGKVTDTGGKPINGAHVILRADDDVIQPNGVIVLTGLDGRYSADISRYEWSRSPLRCRALAEGFACATQAVAAGSGRATADYALKPEPWRTTTLRLVDPSGRPVPGIPVSCSIDDLPWLTLTTDSSGRCAVAIAIGQAIGLEVKPEAFRPLRAALLNDNGAPAEVTVPLRAPIVGRVHDGAGRPLAGITVGSFISEDQKGTVVHAHFFSESVRTAADGSFSYSPTMMLKDRDLEARPDHKRFPQSICFADPDGTRVAFGFFDESGPGAPLDITLELRRPVRIPIEFETVRPSADAQGFLNIFIQPRHDVPEFVLPVLGKRLGPAELTGSGHVTLRLPAGEYVLAADCFTKESRRLGKAEGTLVVPRGDGPLDARALRVRAPLQQRMAGKPAPEIDATDLDTGKPVRLADFRGKVVVLDFWGYWCGPCTGSMPHLVALHRKFAGRPVAVIALHDQSVQSRADYDRRIAYARRAFWNGEDLPFRVLLDRPDPDKPADRDPEGTGVTCKRYGVVGFPTLFVIDQDGKIAAPVRHGDHEGLERLVQVLLDKSAAAGTDR
jgi:thiol-disulfide isomerase/thioredoxin